MILAKLGQLIDKLVAQFIPRGESALRRLVAGAKNPLLEWAKDVHLSGSRLGWVVHSTWLKTGKLEEAKNAEHLAKLEQEAKNWAKLLEERATAVIARGDSVITPKLYAQMAASSGVRQGLTHGSRAAGTAGGATLKQWVRTYPVSRPRDWHTSLEGKKIPEHEKFVLPGGPHAGSLVEGPHDWDSVGSASEWLNCGHAVIYIQGSSVPSSSTVGAVSDVSRDPVRSSGGQNEDLPPARPLPFSADGRSIATIIEVPPEREFIPAQNAIDLISRVHGDGRLPGIGFRVDQGLGDEELAAYVSDPDTGRALFFGLHPDMDYDEFAVVHEVGHLLDHWEIGEQRVFASLTGDPLLEGWRKAIFETQAVRNLEALRGEEFAMVGTRVKSVDQSTLRYYLNPKEMFARSYAQYIAISSGDIGLLGSLSERIPSRANPMLYDEHWQSNDFEPVAREFDALFRGLGWLK